jgi:putative membrane protein
MGAGNTEDVPTSSAVARVQPPERAAGPALSDANIAAIVVAANMADIAYADQALAKSRDAEIRGFAQMTRKDHETMNDVATKLVTRLKVTPVDHEVSFDLRDDAESKRGMLRDLEGFAFDSAYIANEVSYHRSVLAAIDDALIPSAKNAELKALILQVRPAIAAHLRHAETVAATKVRRR